MMSLADLIATVRTGIVRISFLDANANRIAGGTGFLTRGRLLTNHHVFLGHQGANSVHLQREKSGNVVVLTPAAFAAALRSGSMEVSFDYAILEIPQLINNTGHQFVIENPGNRRMGDQISILGFPLEHQNLTAHAGIISSFYQSNLTEIIQLDASVNAGNSGGPLIDPQSGAVYGMVSRKATGLTRLFDQLQQAIDNNIQVAQQAVGVMHIGNFDPTQAFVAGQNIIRGTLSEIQRQANVGIGYAISARHVLADAQLPAA
jgi:S1-C subfamily serine protease